MPRADYDNRVPAPWVPYVDMEDYFDSLDPFWDESPDISDPLSGLGGMFPTSGDGYDVVEPYLKEIERLLEEIQEDTKDLNELLSEIYDDLYKLVEDAEHVPSPKFKFKINEINRAKLFYEEGYKDNGEEYSREEYIDDLNRLFQEARNIYDALPDDAKLQERWNKIMFEFNKIRFKVDVHNDVFFEDFSDEIQELETEIQEFKNEYNPLKNGNTLSDVEKLKYEGYEKDLEVYEKILDLYKQHMNDPLDQTFYEKELGYYEELATNAKKQFKGQNKPDNDDMSLSDWQKAKEKREGMHSRNGGLVLTEIDGNEINQAYDKLHTYIFKYDKAGLTGNIPPANLDSDKYNKAKDEQDWLVEQWKEAYEFTEDRFRTDPTDKRVTLNADEVPMHLHGSHANTYENASDMGMTKLWDTGDGVAYDDIVQGGLGDCFFLAALAAVACIDNQVIKDNIKDNGDGTYDVTLYLLGVEVTQNEDGVDIISRADDPSVRNKIVVTVTSKFVANGQNQSTYASSEAGEDEMWVVLYEKALAHVMGGYQHIKEGGFSHEALSIITNKTVSTYYFLPTTDSNGDPKPSFIAENDAEINNLITQLAAGKIATVSTSVESTVTVDTVSPTVTNVVAGNTATLVAPHACAILEYDAGGQRFKMYNPLGWTFWVDKADFVEVFDGISIVD
ncbi:MAG: C2 family cysteine protease [Flavobacteriales bacterium]|nr:C2 family cysteine protease [Flavobacteriales bacterium]